MRRCMRAWAATLLSLLVAPVCGQNFRIIPKEVLDSLANPVAAADSPMRFEQTTIDAGTLNEEDAPATYTFHWKHAGDTPLVITEARTGCGCVTVAYDRRPVRPGERRSVDVTYHPKGHPGHFQRKIQLFTQTGKGPAAVLTLTGTVTPSVRPTHNYPHVMGPLRLKQQQVRMSGTRPGVERIEVLNAGDEPLTLTANKALLPAWLTVRSDPQTIGAGATADIEIAFDPAKAPAKIPQRVPVILEGLALPPGQRTLYVQFGEAIE